MNIRSVLIVAALVLAACGGGSSDTTQASSDGAAGGSTTSAPGVDVNAAVTAYTECLRGNGIEVEDPTVDENGNLVPPMPLGAGFGPGGGQPGGSAPDSGQSTTPGSTPPGSVPGLDEDTLAAIQDCTTLLNGTEYEGSGGFGGGGGDFEAAFAELSACLAEQGIEIDLPDDDAQPDTTVQPDSDGGPGQFGPGGPGGALGGLDLEDPEVQAAMEVCGDLLPNFGDGGPAGPPTSADQG